MESHNYKATKKWTAAHGITHYSKMSQMLTLWWWAHESNDLFDNEEIYFEAKGDHQQHILIKSAL